MATNDMSTEQDNRYRLGLPEWLHQQVDSGLHKNVVWIDEKENIFQIPWKHASMNCWEDKDASLFKAWAVYTNRYREGVDEPKHKQWKSNFRCAINSHNRVFFVKEQDRGRIANRRVIRIVDSGRSEKKYESRVPKRKLYTSSRSKAKDGPCNTRGLNSIETLENCAKLLLSLKRSSSTGSTSSTTSNISLDMDPNDIVDTDEDCISSNDSAGNMQIATTPNVDLEQDPYSVVKVKEESTWSDDDADRAIYNDFTTQKNIPILGNQSMAQAVDESVVGGTYPVKDHLRKLPGKSKSFVNGSPYSYPFPKEAKESPRSPIVFSSPTQGPRVYQRAPSASHHLQFPVEYEERSIKCPAANLDHSLSKNSSISKQKVKIPKKCSIPTTVIVTINNNFSWQQNPGVDGNKQQNLKKDHSKNKEIKEEIRDTRDHQNGVDDDDLIMPREW